MTQAERNRRKKYFPFTWRTISDEINSRYRDAKKGIIISPDTVRKVINGQRQDRHGIIDTYRAMTDAEQKRRTDASSRLFKDLEA
jgi:hypothetical protein